MQTTKGWHIADWGFWGWLETAVKGVGILAGIIAFISTSGEETRSFSDHPELGALIILGLFGVVAVAVLGLRVMQREIISIIFWLLSVFAHWGLFLALLRHPDARFFAVLFGLAFIAGEVVKQRFLVVSGYTENGQSTAAMVNFSRSIAFFYLLFIIFILI